MGKAQRIRRQREAEAAERERLIEEHLQLRADREGDPRFSALTRHADGSATVTMTDELAEAVRHQIVLFEERFGRPPGPDDPLLFDPDQDEPAPLDPDKFLAEVERASARAGMPEVGAAVRELGYIVSEQNRHHFSVAELDAWDEAIDRHRKLAS